MTLDERALAHGRAALASPEAERVLGGLWVGIPPEGVRVLASEVCDMRTCVDMMPALDLACVMYAQDVAEGRHT